MLPLPPASCHPEACVGDELLHPRISPAPGVTRPGHDAKRKTLTDGETEARGGGERDAQRRDVSGLAGRPALPPPPPARASADASVSLCDSPRAAPLGTERGAAGAATRMFTRTDEAGRKPCSREHAG